MPRPPLTAALLATLGGVSLLFAPGCEDSVGGGGGIPDSQVDTPDAAVDHPAPPADASFGDPLAGTGSVAEVQGGFNFTEGPVWMGDRLRFSDEGTNTIYELVPPSAITTWRTSSGGANGNGIDPQGNMVTCEGANRRVSRTLVSGTVETVVDHYMGMRFNSPNDNIVRSDGTIYFTDPDYNLPGTREIPFNGVYRVAPGGQLSLVTMTLQEPNGIALSPDEQWLYVDDTQASLVERFPVLADGSTGAGAMFVATAGTPDGMGVDDAGNLYVATQAGIQVFRPDASMIGTVAVPEVPANCTFGGSDRQTLYITARTGLYQIHLNVPGRP